MNRSEAVSPDHRGGRSKVLANGNMMIQGRQEVRINNELRELTVAGPVRPRTSPADNTILHTQIAEARVSYGGRGAISRVQKVPAGQGAEGANHPLKKKKKKKKKKGPPPPPNPPPPPP